ncbi:hypothetical protein ACFE04_021284 [Oxalis oulophora]
MVHEDYLDENKSLILKIVESPNTRKLTSYFELPYFLTAAKLYTEMENDYNIGEIIRDNIILTRCVVVDSYEFFVDRGVFEFGSIPCDKLVGSIPRQDVNRADEITLGKGGRECSEPN